MDNFTKLEMYDFLADNIGLGQETMDVIIQVFGDSVDTYRKVLRKTSPYKTFAEGFEAFQIRD